MNLTYRIYIFIVTLFLLVSCARREESIRIGVSQSNHDDWRDKMDAEIERQALFSDGIEVEIRSADWNNDRQAEDIRYFIAKGFDVIIVSPNDADALAPVIAEAYRKGIPVITVDRAIPGDTYTTHIEVDNAAIGARAAHYAAARFGNEGVKAIELQGRSDMTPTRRRHEGFEKALDSIPGAELIATVYCDWEPRLAAEAADSLLALYPDVNFIFAHNDSMAIGVADILKERGREDIFLVGIDGNPKEGIQAVADGRLDATLLYPTEGARLVKRAQEILGGQPVEKTELIAPLPPVEKEEAEILLQQNRLLDEETMEIELLRGKVAEYLDRYTLQRILFYSTVVVIIVLFGVIFIFYRSAWQRMKKNRTLKIEEEIEMKKEGVETTAISDDKGNENEKISPWEKNGFYGKFITVVRDNIHNPNLTIDSIASEVGLSKSQLGRRIKNLTGYTPVELIRNERLKEAKILLTSSQEKSVSEVAYMVGFSLPAYFSKCYRDFYGESPTEVRKRVFG